MSSCMYNVLVAMICMYYKIIFLSSKLNAVVLFLKHHKCSMIPTRYAPSNISWPCKLFFVSGNGNWIVGSSLKRTVVGNIHFNLLYIYFLMYLSFFLDCCIPVTLCGGRRCLLVDVHYSWGSCTYIVLFKHFNWRTGENLFERAIIKL